MKERKQKDVWTKIWEVKHKAKSLRVSQNKQLSPFLLLGAATLPQFWHVRGQSKPLQEQEPSDFHRKHKFWFTRSLQDAAVGIAVTGVTVAAVGIAVTGVAVAGESQKAVKPCWRFLVAHVVRGRAFTWTGIKIFNKYSPKWRLIAFDI